MERIAPLSPEMLARIEARKAAEPCKECGKTGEHVEGCSNHPDYFRDCLMDARYWRRGGYA